MDIPCQGEKCTWGIEEGYDGKFCMLKNRVVSIDDFEEEEEECYKYQKW